MNFTPKTEDQLISESLLPEGIYSFEVMEAGDLRSKKGNDMIKLKLRVFPNNPDEGERHIYDYLLESMAFKLRHFCAYTGLIEKYNSGTLTAHDCLNKSGFVKLIQDQDKEKKYDPKNVVKDYVSSGDSVKTSSAKNDLADDDIQF